ncbi:MAG: HIT family protein [Dehalococcoidia bacterium]
MSTAEAGTAAKAGCLLCEKARGNEDDQNFVLLRGTHVYAFLYALPYNTGHTLIAPYAHTEDLPALDAATSTEMMTLAQRIVAVLRDTYRPDAFNAGMNLGIPTGAALVEHLHMHVVPRWSGDTNFMPVLAGTKVLPETLEQTYARLKRVLSPES